MKKNVTVNITNLVGKIEIYPSKTLSPQQGEELRKQIEDILKRAIEGLESSYSINKE